MIITNIADGQVTNDKLVEFNFRDIAYSVTGDNGTTISSQVPAQGYTDIDVTAAGNPPYTVQLGYVNGSYRAAPVTVNSPDALCMFWMAFPAGPNGPTTFVFEKS